MTRELEEWYTRKYITQISHEKNRGTKNKTHRKQVAKRQT